MMGIKSLYTLLFAILLLLLGFAPSCSSSIGSGNNRRPFSSSSSPSSMSFSAEELDSSDFFLIKKTLIDAMEMLLSVGVPQEQLCRIPTIQLQDDDPILPIQMEVASILIPLCSEETKIATTTTKTMATTTTTTTTYQEKLSQSPRKQRNRWIRSRSDRSLKMEVSEEDDEGDREQQDGQDETDSSRPWEDYIPNTCFAVLCVITAALAAGLTMGLLSLDPLMLLIKIRAGATQQEQDQAAALLPIVKQHHLLLVTLLLLNSMANEALPLFLEDLVSPLVAVILSVTLVLFFGEIVPSAIFTGPNKVALAYQMVPLVKLMMILLWPLAYPIAKLLDHVLHEDDDGENPSDAFGRGELSALVRIQYEERMAHKKRKKDRKKSVVTKKEPSERGGGNGGGTMSTTTNTKIATKPLDTFGNNVGALDFASTQAIKASKRTMERQSSLRMTDLNNNHNNALGWEDPLPSSPSPPKSTWAGANDSIHLDEVSMVEGALSMKTKVALDVYTPVHRLMAIPYDMILTEENMVTIYAGGFSRIPVYQPNIDRPRDHTRIVGILMTKRLIVVDAKENRPLSTLPLSCPQCVSPKMNLVDLLNLFQSGTLGHLALVCARPTKGQQALDDGDPLPESAGFMG